MTAAGVPSCWTCSDTGRVWPLESRRSAPCPNCTAGAESAELDQLLDAPAPSSSWTAQLSRTERWALVALPLLVLVGGLLEGMGPLA